MHLNAHDDMMISLSLSLDILDIYVVHGSCEITFDFLDIYVHISTISKEREREKEREKEKERENLLIVMG